VLYYFTLILMLFNIFILYILGRIAVTTSTRNRIRNQTVLEIRNYILFFIYSFFDTSVILE